MSSIAPTVSPTDDRTRAPGDPSPTVSEPDDHQRLVMPRVDPWWRRWSKDRRAMHHHRLVVTVVVANLVAAAAVREPGGPPPGFVEAAVLANLALAALVRQQRVINLLFRVATSAPTSWPLRVRWTLGKVYHFGGLHVGGALVATAWFAVATVHTLSGSATSGTASRPVAVLTVAILVLLGALLITAAPRLRARHHDLFEVAHRFGGWAVLVAFAARGVLVAATTPGAPALWRAPATWVFLLVVASVSSTWWHLRRVPVTLTRPSDHVVLAEFTHRTPFAGSSTALSRSPLREWHHFANVPAPGREGFRLTISRAGDWTGDLIDDLPSHVWTKGIPTAGVGNIDRLFRKALWVATGSGIGPCLPHLLSGDTPARLVWSTRAPRATYGDALVDELRSVQPDAVIWDTTELGKPDLVRLAFATWEQADAEAVICISNKPTTWTIVESFERRGIPAFGAIWDS